MPDNNVIWHVDFRAKGNGHTSTCATSNGPALPVGECDCGGTDILKDIDHIAETVIKGALADDFIVPGVFDDKDSA